MVGHLLCAEATPRGEPFGEPGKTGDVGENQGANQLPRTQIGRLLQPLARELGHDGSRSVEWLAGRSALLMDKAEVLKVADSWSHAASPRVWRSTQFCADAAASNRPDRETRRDAVEQTRRRRQLRERLKERLAADSVNDARHHRSHGRGSRHALKQADLPEPIARVQVVDVPIPDEHLEFTPARTT